MSLIYSTLRHVALPLVTSIVLLMFSVRSNAQSEVPLGTYKVDAARSESLMNQSVRLKYDSLNAELRARVKSGMQDREFKFLKDGIVEVRWKVNDSEKVLSGTTVFHSEKSVLVIKMNDKETTYLLSRPEPNAIILHNPNGFGLLNTLYLIKID